MSYFSDVEKIWKEYLAWLQLLKERKLRVVTRIKKLNNFLLQEKKSLEQSFHSACFPPEETDNLQEIRSLRPVGPRNLVEKLNQDQLEDKILGAWLGRAAGCILGIPCEGMSKEAIRFTCLSLGLDYPLGSYWKKDPKPVSPETLHYETTPRKKYLQEHLSCIGADDDLAYTLLGLLILEEYGYQFTTEDVARAWLKYLPFACTAEAVALSNLKKGVSPYLAGSLDNPYVDWIGADIRSDPWAYAAPAAPEKAAEMAYRDAFLSHRGTGVHAAMFFSAAISAAFVCHHPLKAIEIGLTEIPEKCRLSRTVLQTIDWCEKDSDWEKTTSRILRFYQGMSGAHALNNAALTVAGLFYGAGDFTRTISLTVMAGLDTDCTGATAGSLLGALLGARNLPADWKKPLGNNVETYLLGQRKFKSTEVASRFTEVAHAVLHLKRKKARGK